MANLPNPFEFGVFSVSTPDETAASLRHEDVAVDFQSSCGGTESRRAHVTGCAVGMRPELASPNLMGRADDDGALDRPVGVAPDPQEANHIGEIFVGARKLDQLPGPFDQAAINGRDELLYVTLKLMDEPGTRDLPCIPDEQAFIEALEPMPLFLQMAV